MNLQTVVLRAALLAVILPAANPVPASPRQAGTQAAPEVQLAVNKSLARRVYEEGLSQGKFEVPYTSGFVGHGRGATFTHAQGLAEATGWRSAFPDLRVAVDLILAEGDLVSVRWTARGTNSGTGNGIEATGRRVEVSGTTIFRFEDGKIAEEWTAGDVLGMLKQLGLMPTATASLPPDQR